MLRRRHLISMISSSKNWIRAVRATASDTDGSKLGGPQPLELVWNSVFFPPPPVRCEELLMAAENHLQSKTSSGQKKVTAKRQLCVLSFGNGWTLVTVPHKGGCELLSSFL